MIKSLSAASPYKSLPCDYTRKNNLNRAFRKVRKSAAVGQSLIAITTITSLFSIAIHNAEHACFNIAMLLSSFGLWWKDIKTAQELHPVYEEILHRKKAIYHK